MKSNNIILALIVVLIILSVFILIIRNFLIPLFFRPKFHSTEIFPFLEKRGLSFIDSTYLTKAKRRKFDSKKSDKSILEKFISVKSDYLITVFSKQQNEVQLFLLEINNWLFPYPKWIYETLVGKRIENRRELNFTEINNPEKLKIAQKSYKNEVIIKDKCPACNNRISPADKVCSDCGLTLNII